MEPERCYVCRTPIPVDQVSRRVMTTAHYSGASLGGSSGLFSFTKSEVVSLCAACDAAEARRLMARPGCLLTALAAWCIVWIGVSAFFFGYWLLGTVWTGLVVWRVVVWWKRRRAMSAVGAPTTAAATRSPQRIDHQPLDCPRDWSGDDGD